MDIFILRDKTYKFLNTDKGRKYLTTKSGESFLKGTFGDKFIKSNIGKKFMTSKESIKIRKMLDNQVNQIWKIDTIDDISVCNVSTDLQKVISDNVSKQKGTTNTDKNKESLEEKTSKDTPKQKNYPAPKREPIKGI